MQRIKGKISISKYIMICCSTVLLIMTVFILGAIDIMTKEAVRETVQNDLRREMLRIAKHVEKRGGKVFFSNDFEKDDESYYFIVTDSAGRYVCGEYPENYDISKKYLVDHGVAKIEMSDQMYYVMDMTKQLGWRGIEGSYILRGFINSKDVTTIYQTLHKYSYFIILLVIGALFLIVWSLQRYVSKPLIHMCKVADEISEELDFSEEIEYNGFFYELDTLLKAYNRLLKRMDKVVSGQKQFNSDVSHELRTPIAVIRAQCQLSRGHAEKERDEELLEALEVIERQSDKMNQMVEQLLNLSRLEQNRMELEFEDIDLVEMIESVCEDEEYLLENKYCFFYDLRSTIIRADMNLITMVIRNLVSNAVKYSPVGSEIHVSCGRKGDQAFFSVRDFGCGIEEKNIKKIFEYYYRSEESRNSEGFGLGLTLSMKIAKCHGGTILVESKQGQGSTFTLLLPAAERSLDS